MTCNQLILLMEVRRGYDENDIRWGGTTNRDLKRLMADGYIQEGSAFGLMLTVKGAKLCDILMEVAAL